MTTELRNELRTRVERWIDANFNLLPLDVVEREHMHDAGDHLSASIECEWYDLSDDDDRALALSHLDGHGYELGNDPADWAIEDALREITDEQYPMWGTLFELRHADYPNDDACREAGFVVISAFGPFNAMLGVAGCGYSFYGAHWIPLWLSLQDDETRQRFADVHTDSM